MAISRSEAKSPDGKRIKTYWEDNKQEEGGVLRELLRLREVEDVDILWCLRKAIEERDAKAIQICGYMLSIMSLSDRKNHLYHILGWPIETQYSFNS